MNSYTTITGVSEGEISVERSRFIAAAVHVESEEQALEFISKKRAEYHDAKHNCYAYILRSGISRFSDDGEPHSTAGKPILEVIEGEELFDVCVVVTRYFGGVLLGTGGLVRAYTAATKEALVSATRQKLERCFEYKITCDYSEYDYLLKNLSRFGTVLGSDFTDKVCVIAAIRAEIAEEFQNMLQKTFRTTARFENLGEKVLPV